ncbi:MAG: hypothetical protein AAGF20_10440 [Pseudomonadota bacterium]
MARRASEETLEPRRRRVGLRTGLTTLVASAIAVIAAMTFGPSTGPPPTLSRVPAEAPQPLAALLEEPDIAAWFKALEAAKPFAAADIRARLVQAARDKDEEALARLILLAAFGQFNDNAREVKAAPVSSYDRLLDHVEVGFRALKAQGSDWCNGAHIEDFLRQNDTDLVPRLLDQFHYGTEGYAWALTLSRLTLEASLAGQNEGIRHRLPSPTDKLLIQQRGVRLGAEQWLLALQVSSFSNAEGQSYALMREAVSNLQVCDLALAVTGLSDELPEDTRVRVWADLIPEMMVANTPYVLARMNDYFFLD